MIRKLQRSLQNYLRISGQEFLKKSLKARQTPLRFFEGLEGRKDYKLRVGDYRVIADINKNKKRIEITKIGHRKSIYRKD